MSLYLDTRGMTIVAIGICDRCKMKRSLTQLVSDPNAPGLRVCQDRCVDLFDPWRLPARATENITLRYPRPDVPLTVDDVGVTYLGTEFGVIFVTETGIPFVTEQPSP